MTLIRPRSLVLVAGFALAVGACSGAGATTAPAAPGATAAPAGAASAAPIGNAPVNPSQPAASLAIAPPNVAANAASPCGLLTRAEVAAAFKETMQEPAVDSSGREPSCSYTHEANGLDLTVTISSRPSSVAAIKAAAAYYPNSPVITGIGDAAFEFAGILEFVKGTTLVTIGTGDGPAIISDADFQGLAKLAAGRI